MDLPIFDQFSVPARPDAPRTSGGSSANAPDAPFANLLTRDKAPADTPPARDHEEQASDDGTSSVGAVSPPPDAPPPRETIDNKDAEQEERDTNENAAAKTSGDDAGTAEDSAPPQPAETGTQDSTPLRVTTDNDAAQPRAADKNEAAIETPGDNVPAHPTDESFADAEPHESDRLAHGSNANASSLSDGAAARIGPIDPTPATRVQTPGETSDDAVKQQPRATEKQRSGRSKRAKRGAQANKSAASVDPKNTTTPTADKQVSSSPIDGTVASSVSSIDAAELSANTDTAAEPNGKSPDVRATITQLAESSAASNRPLHASARSSAQASDSGEISQIDQTRLIQRVARAIHAAPQRGGVIRLRLRPPELGSLHLEVSMERGGLSARLETETHMARSVLLENLPQLRERLAEQGIRLQQFDVGVSEQDAGQSHEQTQQSGQQFESADSGPRQSSSKRDSPSDDESPQSPVTNIIHQKNLNVVI